MPGCLFHRLQGERGALYRLYVTADSVMRWAAHAVRRDVVRRAAYAELSRVACADLLRHRPTR